MMPGLGNACKPLTRLGAWAVAGTSLVGAAGCLHGSGSCGEKRDRVGTRPRPLPWPPFPTLDLTLLWEIPAAGGAVGTEKLEFPA